MISPYQSLINHEGDDWQDFLDKCLMIDIFMPVIKEYGDPQTLKCVIRYIVYAYSVQSDKVVLGMDWQKNKQNIFEFVMVKPEAKSYEDLVLLKNKAVIDTIHKWLEFQDNISFAHLSVLRDLKIEMQMTALTDIRKSSGEIDFDQKYRNAEYASKLQEKIKELEAELVQNNIKMKDNIKEVRMAKSKFNVGPETFAK